MLFVVFVPETVLRVFYFFQNRHSSAGKQFSEKLGWETLADVIQLRQSRWTYRVLNSSYLARFLRVKLNILRAELTRETIERSPSEDHLLFARTVETTSAIMDLVKTRSGSTPIVAFNAIEADWIRDHTFKEIASRRDMHFVAGIHGAIQEAKAKGLDVEESPGDVHWNANGHAIAGQRILEFLIEKGLL